MAPGVRRRLASPFLTGQSTFHPPEGLCIMSISVGFKNNKLPTEICMWQSVIRRQRERPAEDWAKELLRDMEKSVKIKRPVYV